MGPVALAILILMPQRMYYQPRHPVPLHLDLQRLRDAVDDTAVLSLHLMEFEGHPVASVGIDRVDQIDLNAVFGNKATLWDGRTLLVQLAADGEPVGAPLVVVPLRMPGSRAGERPDALRVVVLRDVLLNTDHGPMRAELFHHVAPNTVMHFEHLVDGGFYTGIGFHRVIPGFVIQGGDPTGTGRGGPGYMLDLEPSSVKHDVGVLSMARRGNDVNSSGSQFFICLSREATAALDGQYTAFGQVVEGLRVMESIAETPLVDAASGRPIKAPKIETAVLVPAKPRPVPRVPIRRGSGRSATLSPSPQPPPVPAGESASQPNE